MLHMYFRKFMSDACRTLSITTVDKWILKIEQDYCNLNSINYDALFNTDNEDKKELANFIVWLRDKIADYFSDEFAKNINMIKNKSTLQELNFIYVPKRYHRLISDEASQLVVKASIFLFRYVSDALLITFDFEDELNEVVSERR